ncbi:26S proteasome regulatory subunit 7 homolog A [Tanacetum coccineum]
MPTDIEDEIKDEKNPRPLDEDDIALLKTYGLGPYSTSIKKAEKDVKDMAKRINDLCGIKESDTGLAAPSQWDLVSDKQMMQEEQPLQVARCTKIINPNTEDAKYVINVKQIAKFVVGLGDKVSPTDIEEGMRVGVDRTKYQIQIPLPPKIDPSVTMMTVEEKPDVTYNDVGGCKEQIEKMREVVELPMLHPEKFVQLGIDPPKGVLCYGPPGTGKTLLARAVANRTDACFIRVIGSELVQKYVGEGARMVRELFQMARSKKACIVFFDEVDAIGGARFDDGAGGDNEVQRTMLEIVNQLDGFDARGNIKVLMATNRPDTLDPALLRPGRLDRKVEFGLPDMESRTQIFKIHTRTMNCERDVRFELLARLCPNSTGADIRSVCTEAGMYAIRARRKTVTEKDFLDAVNKVIKGVSPTLPHVITRVPECFPSPSSPSYPPTTTANLNHDVGGLVWDISLNIRLFLFVPLRVFGHMYRKELANFNTDWNLGHARMKDTDMTSRWMLDGEIIDRIRINMRGSFS